MTLKELRLWDGQFHVSDIARAVEAANLEVLDMGKVKLMGCHTDFEQLEEAMHQSTIETFVLVDFQIMDRKVTLDGLTRAIGTLPRVKKIEIEAQKYSNSTITFADLQWKVCVNQKPYRS